MDKCTSRILGNKRLEKCFYFWYDIYVTGNGKRLSRGDVLENLILEELCKWQVYHFDIFIKSIRAM